MVCRGSIMWRFGLHCVGPMCEFAAAHPPLPPRWKSRLSPFAATTTITFRCCDHHHRSLLRPSSPFATIITFRCCDHRTAGSVKPKPNRRLSNWGGRGGANNQVWALSSKSRRCQLHHGTGRSSRWSVVVNSWHALHSLYSLYSLYSWHSWHSFCPQTRTRTSQLHIWQPNIPAVYLRLCQPEWLNSPCGSC
jgi:hypothetical protein